MTRCKFCGEIVDDGMIFTLYYREITENSITTKHINICEMDYEAIKVFDEDKEVDCVEYDGEKYYLREDLEI